MHGRQLGKQLEMRKEEKMGRKVSAGTGVRGLKAQLSMDRPA